MRTAFYLTICRDFPSIDQVVGGERVRPYEFAQTLAERGIRGEAWCVDRVSRATVGGMRVRRLPLPRWRPLRELLAPLAALLVLVMRAVTHRRVVLYQRVPGGLDLRGRLPFLLEPGWIFFGVARFLRIRTWASVHDLSPEHELFAITRSQRSGIGVADAEFDRWTRLGRLNDRLQRWALPRAHVVTVVCESIRRELIARYGLKPERVLVVRAGINPQLVSTIPEWVSPTDGRRWVVGHIGSRFDAEFRLLLAAMKLLEDAGNFELLIAGQAMDTVDLGSSTNVTVRESTYAEFADLATSVDIWAVPVADDTYLQWSWPLKLPMDLATGRPVVVTRTTELDLSGLESLFFVAEPTPKGVAATIEAIALDPDTARSKAVSARATVLRSMSWTNQLSAAMDLVERD